MSKKKKGRKRVRSSRSLGGENTLPQKNDGSGLDLKKIIQSKEAELKKPWAERSQTPATPDKSWVGQVSTKAVKAPSSKPVEKSIAALEAEKTAKGGNLKKQLEEQKAKEKGTRRQNATKQNELKAAQSWTSMQNKRRPAPAKSTKPPVKGRAK